MVDTFVHKGQRRQDQHRGGRHHSPLDARWQRSHRILPFVLLSVVLSGAGAQEDYTCDAQADICGSQSNGVCDSFRGPNPLPGCEDGDCIDCNNCTRFNYDCKGCLAAIGCYFCPGDGTCDNSPGYNYTPKARSCSEPEAYLTDGDVCSLSPGNNFFTDPLYDAQQWVYEMIRIVPVWKKGYFGDGVRVRVNDDGVDGNHSEFDADRFNLTASCTVALPRKVDGTGHGTTVASILGGASNNDQCATGVAPGVSISSCNIFADNVSLSVLSEKVESFDISQNSWGLPACGNGISVRRSLRGLQAANVTNACPFQSRVEGLLYEHPCDVCAFNKSEPISLQCEAAVVTHCDIQRQFENDVAACLEFLDLLIDGECNYDKLPATALDALSTGILEGRDGKGIIYVFSSGDGFASGDDVNFGGLTNSRLTITVGGVGKDEAHASYSTPGAALFVTAPGGDYDAISNHMAAALGGGCTGAPPGTSFAAPIVSGVIALILEAKPAVTWRDVQGILATTSRPVADQNDTTAIINSAGIWHSNYYGFGIIDAEAAVNAAENWTLFSIERSVVGTSMDKNLTITDDPTTPVVSSLNITNEGNDDFIVESTVVSLHLAHSSRGDLEVTLESPSGTLSVLHPGKRIENTQQRTNERWKLLTVRNWGESAYGKWTLRIRDLSAGDVADCADAPFYALINSKEVTCDLIASEKWCIDGSRAADATAEAPFDDLFSTEDNGLTIEQACCRCGGGISSEDVVNELIQWRLVVYGRGTGGFATPDGSLGNDEPTLSPSFGFRPSDPPESLAPASPSGNPLVSDDNQTDFLNETLAPSMSSFPSGSFAPSAATDIDTDTGAQPSPQIDSSADGTTKLTTSESVITIVATVAVFLFVTLAVWWSCRSPNSASRFQPVDKTSEVI